MFKINVTRYRAVRGEIKTERRGTTLGVLAGQSHLHNQRLGPDRTGWCYRDMNICVADDGNTRTYRRRSSLRSGGVLEVVVMSDIATGLDISSITHEALPSTSFSCNPEGPPLGDAPIV